MRLTVGVLLLLIVASSALQSMSSLFINSQWHPDANQGAFGALAVRGDDIYSVVGGQLLLFNGTSFVAPLTLHTFATGAEISSLAWSNTEDAMFAGDSTSAQSLWLWRNGVMTALVNFQSTFSSVLSLATFSLGGEEYLAFSALHTPANGSPGFGVFAVRVADAVADTWLFTSPLAPFAAIDIGFDWGSNSLIVIDSEEVALATQLSLALGATAQDSQVVAGSMYSLNLPSPVNSLCVGVLRELWLSSTSDGTISIARLSNDSSQISWVDFKPLSDALQPWTITKLRIVDNSLVAIDTFSHLLQTSTLYTFGSAITMSLTNCICDDVAMVVNCTATANGTTSTISNYYSGDVSTSMLPSPYSLNTLQSIRLYSMFSVCGFFNLSFAGSTIPISHSNSAE